MRSLPLYGLKKKEVFLTIFANFIFFYFKLKAFTLKKLNKVSNKNVVFNNMNLNLVLPILKNKSVVIS
jgi:hypothetical protein